MCYNLSMNILMTISRLASTVTIFLLFGFFSINYYVDISSRDYIFQTIKDAPSADVIVILGAGVRPNKEMSDVFRDRVDVAIELYEGKKADKILVSGYSEDEYYDEVKVANKYLLEAGVKEENILLDGAGYNTFESMRRMREITNANSFLIVTQNFHLPRSLYIARKLGMESYGVSADLHEYEIEDKMFYREKLANIKAFIDVHLR